MKALADFRLPISGLGIGLHEYDFEIKDEFFTHFEASPVSKADINMKVYLDKRSDLIELTFDFSGQLGTECDRCLGKFQLPVKENNSLLVKLTGDEEESDDIDIIYISKKENELDISKFVYEFVLLSVPMSKNHEMAGEQCDESFTKFLHQEVKEEKKPSKSVWDALKKFNKN